MQFVAVRHRRIYPASPVKVRNWMLHLMTVPIIGASFFFPIILIAPHPGLTPPDKKCMALGGNGKKTFNWAFRCCSKLSRWLISGNVHTLPTSKPAAAWNRLPQTCHLPQIILFEVLCSSHPNDPAPLSHPWKMPGPWTVSVITSVQMENKHSSASLTAKRPHFILYIPLCCGSLLETPGMFDIVSIIWMFFIKRLDSILYMKKQLWKQCITGRLVL